MKHFAALLLGLSFATATNAISVELVIYAATCDGNNGAVTTTVSGGIAPYTYDWSTGSTEDMIYGLVPGTYSLTVTDNVGVQATVTTDVGQVAQPPSNMTPFDFLGLGGLEPCGWLCDGGFRLHVLRVMGGYTMSTTPSMSYTELPEDETGYEDHWITYEFLGVCGGQSVTLQLSNSCGVGSSTVTIDDILWPQVNVQQTSASCNGADDGALFGEVTLAVSPITGSNYWNMVAIDYPITGNQVEPTPNNFNFGTTPFQVLGLHPAVWDLYFTTVEGDGSAQAPCAYGAAYAIPDLGPDCAMVSGTIHFETDLDCTQNGLEVGMPDQLLRVTPGPLYGITGSDGSYEIAVPYGSYDLEQLNPDAVQLCPPAAPIPFAVSAGNNVVVDIADSLITPFNMGVYTGHTPSRVGLPFQFWIHLVNLTGHPGYPFRNREISDRKYRIFA